MLVIVILPLNFTSAIKVENYLLILASQPVNDK